MVQPNRVVAGRFRPAVVRFSEAWRASGPSLSVTVVPGKSAGHAATRQRAPDFRGTRAHDPHADGY